MKSKNNSFETRTRSENQARRMGKSPKNKRESHKVVQNTATEAAFREQMENSLKNQMDASFAGMDDSVGNNTEGGFPLPSLRRNMSGEGQGEIQREYAQQLNSEYTREQLLEAIVNPHIDEDSPAAAALRANAQVHIGRMGKVARSINAQTIRKVAKRASLRSHFGNVKGKPPRVPPSQMASSIVDPNNIYEIQEEGELDEDLMGEQSFAENVQDDIGGSKDSEPDSPPSLANINSSSREESESVKQGQRVSFSVDPPSPAKSRDVVCKEVPPIVQQHPGDHIHFSLLQDMKNNGPSVKALAPEMDQKDIPKEVVEGTMEAGRKGKEVLVCCSQQSTRGISI